LAAQILGCERKAVVKRVWPRPGSPDRRADRGKDLPMSRHIGQFNDILALRGKSAGVHIKADGLPQFDPRCPSRPCNSIQPVLRAGDEGFAERAGKAEIKLNTSEMRFI